MNHPKNQEMLNSQWDPHEPPQKSRDVKPTVRPPWTTPNIKEVLESDNKGRVVSTVGFIYM